MTVNRADIYREHKLSIAPRIGHEAIPYKIRASMLYEYGFPHDDVSTSSAATGQGLATKYVIPFAREPDREKSQGSVLPIHVTLTNRETRRIGAALS